MKGEVRYDRDTHKPFIMVSAEADFRKTTRHRVTNDPHLDLVGSTESGGAAAAARPASRSGQKRKALDEAQDASSDSDNDECGGVDGFDRNERVAGSGIGQTSDTASGSSGSEY